MRMNWTTSLIALALLTLFGVAAVPDITSAGTAEGTRPAPLSTVSRVCLLVDATDSVDVTMPHGATRRDAYLAATRSIIRATQRAGLPLTLGRTCGVSEMLWDAPIARNDFAAVTVLIESALKSCDGRTSAVTSARRSAGTDLVNALDWLVRKPDGSILVLITDGVNTAGRNPAADFLRALDRLPAGVRARLWLVGLDEGVRDAIGSRVGHSAGLFDLQTTAVRLTDIVRRRGN